MLRFTSENTVEAATRLQTANEILSATEANLIVPLAFECDVTNKSAQFPVTTGIPFPCGAIREPFTVSLRDSRFGSRPVQAEPLAYWPDGSVQWLLCDFIVPGTSGAADNLCLEVTRPNRVGTVLTDLKKHESHESLFVESGTQVFCIPKTELRPFVSATPADQVFDCGVRASSEIVLTDRRGRRHVPRLTRWRIESYGPIQITIVMEGDFPSVGGLRLRLRSRYYTELALVRFEISLHNPNRARHRRGLWDLGDAGSVLFEDMSLHIDLPEESGYSLKWSTTPNGYDSKVQCSEFLLYQGSSGGINWDSRSQVNRENRNPCKFRGYQLSVDDVRSAGLRASPTVSFASKTGAMTIAVPEFWQQFPKALAMANRRVRLGLFPREFGDLFELQGGESKCHAFWLQFSGAISLDGIPTPGSLDWTHCSPRVRVPLDWLEKCGVVPPLVHLATPQQRNFDTVLQEARIGPRSIPAHREAVDEFGWRNYGDVFADHEQLHYQRAEPLVSHYNNQFDMLYGMQLQHLRTGESDWWDWADALARHVTDIDIYHTEEDRAAYNGGLFWFTDHYLHAHTSTHRTYSKHNRSSSWQSYGGGPSAEHNFTSGLLLHYYITGNLNSRDAVVSLADWVIQMDLGRATILGIVDDAPTGLATRSQQIGRAAGNSINALLDAWSLTRDGKYLSFAETCIRRCVHPNDDVDSRNLLDVERSWSYTVFLRSLAKYLDLKAQADQIDLMYAYAQTTLVRYAQWMLEHERPYFDQLEKLEFPTEAWAAQEFRKANVLRLAARHTEEPLRTNLLDRGDALGTRAWSDLMGFETQATARALAIVMTEGLLDCTLRSRDFVPAPRSLAHHDFGQPCKFVSQRERIKLGVRHPFRMARMMSRLANPRRWQRYLRSPSQESDVG